MEQTGTAVRPWSIECLIEWLRIREREGVPFPTSLLEFVTDIDHSALLQRLAKGKEPLPAPPPLSFSYPWYELMEQGYAEPIDVWVGDKTTNEMFGYRAIVINQTPWKVVEQTSDEEYILTYGENSPNYRLLVSGVSDRPGLDGTDKVWRLEKIDSPHPAASTR